MELFNDDNGKPRGCGVVEFTNSEAMRKALYVMHRYELNGRKLVIKEETGLYNLCTNLSICHTYIQDFNKDIILIHTLIIYFYLHS